MFDIGFWELTLIMVIVLIVVGPERLPGMARTAGVWISKIRRMAGEVKAEVERELRAEELRGNLEKGTFDEIKRMAGDMRSIGRDLQRDVAEANKRAGAATPALGPSAPSPRGAALAGKELPQTAAETAPVPTPGPAAESPSAPATPPAKLGGESR